MNRGKRKNGMVKFKLCWKTKLYFKKIYPFVDASDGTLRQEFDLCFDNWIEKNDWLKIIDEIEHNLEHISDSERKFLSDFIKWLEEALKHTTIIVVEGNL